MENISAVVLCGGWGSRMGDFMHHYKCKSLIPILGIPCLRYVLEALSYIKCSQSILCIDREDLYLDVKNVAERVGLPYIILKDSGHGPTNVVIESLPYITSSNFLVLNGHQIIYPEFLLKIIDSEKDFVATLYSKSTEGTRKIAIVNSNSECIRIRKGSFDSPATESEWYLDKPYILHTETIRNSLLSGFTSIKDSPVDIGHRHDTILRYAYKLYTFKANFRHEFHYENELKEVEQFAKVFITKYL